MYAFGMLAWEVRARRDISIACFIHHRYKVFAGRVPFADCPPTTVAVRVLLGQRPDRPEHPGLTDELWGMIRRCWEEDALRRPGSSEVVSHLRRASIVQPVHGDALEITLEGWKAGSFLRNVSRRLRGVPSVVTDQFRPERFGGTRCTIPRLGPEGFHRMGTDRSETSLHSMKIRELEEPVGGQTTPSGPCGLFRRPAFWNSRRGTSAALE